MWPELGLKKLLLVARWGKDCNQATVNDVDTRRQEVAYVLNEGKAGTRNRPVTGMPRQRSEMTMVCL